MLDLEKRVEEVRDSLTPGAQWALVYCAQAFRFGGNWGLMLNSKPDYASVLKALNEESKAKNIYALQVKNGAVVFCRESFLASTVNSFVPNAINMKFAKMAKERKYLELTKFNSLIHDVISGKKRLPIAKSGGYCLGLLCTNETNVIRLNGNDYPAYKITPEEAITCLQRVSQNTGVTISVACKNADNSCAYLDCRTLRGIVALKAVYAAVEISNTDTGAFMQVKIDKFA